MLSTDEPPPETDIRIYEYHRRQPGNGSLYEPIPFALQVYRVDCLDAHLVATLFRDPKQSVEIEHIYRTSVACILTALVYASLIWPGRKHSAPIETFMGDRVIHETQDGRVISPPCPAPSGLKPPPARLLTS